MTDDTGNMYTMRVQKLDSLDVSYVRILNFANLFDVLVNPFNTYYNEYSEYKNQFSVGGYFPAVDKNGYRWALFSMGDNTKTPIKESYFINDTLVIWFELSNIAFYIDDNTSYHGAYHTHIAVKTR